jgi:acetylglutamate synthase
LNPVLLKQALETRRVDLEHEGTRGGNTIVIHDYAKAGDQLILTLDGAMKRLQLITVKTYLSSPADPMSITIQFSILPDGTSYPSVTAVDAPAERLSMMTVSANFSRVVP